MPPDAFVCRYGGEEFGILMPGRAIDEAAAASELARIAVRHALLTWGTSISMGLAKYEGHGTEGTRTTTLIDIADKALYRSKANGKDQVTIGSAADLDVHPEATGDAVADSTDTAAA